MANLLTSRKHVHNEPKDWAQKVAADATDRDGWPIRVTAEVTCQRGNSSWTGLVDLVYLDHKDRLFVDVRVDGGLRTFRPGECRVHRSGS